MSLIKVAKAARVSVATASRVLSGSPHPVSEAARQRVLEAAAQLNYSPNSVARALVTRRTHIIGVIVGDIDDPYFSAIVRGIEDVARREGYLAIVCNSDRQPEIELSYLRLLHDYHVDGIIFAGGSLEDGSYTDHLEKALANIHADRIHTAGIGQHPSVGARVSIDNAAATREMVSYLARLGHRRIAYIRGPEGLSTSATRFDAYAQALRTAGLPYNPAWAVPGDFTVVGGYQAAKALMETAEKPTAIFAANDQMAIGVINALHAARIQVPGQVSVVGFDDIPAAAFVQPPLTTIRVPMYALGASIAESLLAAAPEDGPHQERYLAYELVVRQSSAPPPTDD